MAPFLHVLKHYLYPPVGFTKINIFVSLQKLIAVFIISKDNSLIFGKKA